MPSIQPAPVPPPPFILGRTEGLDAPRGTNIPLKSERMRIVVRGRLALVCREQIFRNDEDRTFEATLTFPVPVHATLCCLSARIGERTLAAKAQRRDAARETYEKAVEDGRSAVLHEELVRGVHVLSVANIPAGAAIAVTHSWIAALAPCGDGKWQVRIPITVGDIYGVSPFTDADDLTAANVVHEAQVDIDCGGAVALIGGAPLAAGRSLGVVLDAPIDLEIAGLADAPADGVAADGRTVRVSVTPDSGAATWPSTRRSSSTVPAPWAIRCRRYPAPLPNMPRSSPACARPPTRCGRATAPNSGSSTTPPSASAVPATRLSRRSVASGSRAAAPRSAAR